MKGDIYSKLPPQSPKSTQLSKSKSGTLFSHSTNITKLNTSIPVLEQELRLLKQEEKKFNKLTAKLKMIEKQFKQMSVQQQAEECSAEIETDQIENLKKEIQQCIKHNRRLENQTNEINKQIEQSNRELNSLQGMLTNLREQNKERRHTIKQKGLIYQQKQRHLENIQKQRDSCQVQIETLKLQVEKLVHQQHRLKKEAEIVEFKKEQEQKAAKKFQELVQKLRKEKMAIEVKLGTISTVLMNEEEKYRNIREEISMLDKEQIELLEEVRRRQTLSRQNKQKIIRGRAKIQSLLEQTQNADQDLKLLTSQYGKQTDRLRQLQSKNTELNEQLDQICKDASEIWESLRSTLDLAANNSNDDAWSLDILMRIKGQALEIWRQIESIIQ